MIRVAVVLVFLITCALVFTTQPPSLGLNAINGITSVMAISFVMCSLLYIKHKQSKDVGAHPLLFLNRVLHYATLVFGMFYVFLFSADNDTWYLIYSFVLVFHWVLFKNECILTYWEKKLIDENYVMGSQPYHHVFLQLLAGEYEKELCFVSAIFMYYCVSIVIMRYQYFPYTSKVLLVFGLLIYHIINNVQRFS